MSLVFSRLSEIFGHLPHLNVLDMSDFMEHIGGMRFIRGDTPEMHERFWISIPNSVTHIISKTLTPLSINFQDKEKLEQFITKHSNLQTWCIHSYTEDDDNLFAHLLKPCRNIGISFGTSNWESECPKDLIPHWTFPEANYIASQVLVYPEFWTEETQRNKLESISIGDPSRKELSMIFMGAPNLSTVNYEIFSLDTTHLGRWSALYLRAASLKSVMLFLPPEEIISPSSALLLSTSPFPPDWTYNENEEFLDLPKLMLPDWVEDDHDDHKDRNNDDEGVGGFPFGHLYNIRNYRSSLEGVPPEDGERVSTTAKELETDLATEAATADAWIELEKNCQRVQQELDGLLDRDHFPKMRKVTLVLNPYPHYPREDVRDAVGNALKATLSKFKLCGVEPIICWGELRFPLFFYQPKHLSCIF